MRLEQLRRALPALLVALAGSGLAPVGAQSFDCAKARTPTEQVICTDAQLGRLDSALAKSYGAVRKMLSPSLLGGFVAAQRAWTRRRDRECTQERIDCLRRAYSGRLALMRALLARTSADNPVIDSATAAALVGKWKVDASLPAHPPESLQPTSADLPEAGARITGRIGEICIANPGEEEDCTAFGLAPIAPSRGVAGGPASDSGTPVHFLTYFDGKADFELDVSSSHELVAVYQACNATATRCARREQLWHAASSDARLSVYSATELNAR
jgi:uncharacterized protein